MGYPIHTSCFPGRLVEEVDDEIHRARQKFPSNVHMHVALSEEVGELAKALLESDCPAPETAHPEIIAARGVDALRRRIREEAIQVICVAVRIIEEGDADFPNSVPPGRR